MKIAVVFGSHRIEGKNREIENTLRNSNFNHEFDFIRLAEIEIAPTETPISSSDGFSDVLNRLVNADFILLAVSVYCPYPSKFVALMERLLDVSYQNSNKPLKGKIAIVYYCSVKICDETPIKLLFQKYLMDDYRFDTPNYDKYTNNEPNPNEKYHNDVTQYVLDIVQKL